MAFIEYNQNPNGIKVDDCVVRAISTATGNEWERIYIDLAVKGFTMCDMPNANSVWMAYLHDKGFKRYVIPNSCPNCYTVRDFCRDNIDGTFILATGTHVVTAIGGDYYDTWDSGDKIPIYFFRKE